MKVRFGFFWVVLISGIMLVLAVVGWSQGQTQSPIVRISVPEHDGENVGRKIEVSGSASLPPGTHLWVLVHVTPGFKGFWWPQNEGEVDPKTGTWKVDVTLGEKSEDIGHDFEIVVITVDEGSNAVLHDKRAIAVVTDKYPPIVMPPTTSAPVIRKVRKVSDR